MTDNPCKPAIGENGYPDWEKPMGLVMINNTPTDAAFTPCIIDYDESDRMEMVFTDEMHIYHQIAPGVDIILNAQGMPCGVSIDNQLVREAQEGVGPFPQSKAIANALRKLK